MWKKAGSQVNCFTWANQIQVQVFHSPWRKPLRRQQWCYPSLYCVHWGEREGVWGQAFWSGQSLTEFIVHHWSSCISSFIRYKKDEMFFEVSLSPQEVSFLSHFRGLRHFWYVFCFSTKTLILYQGTVDCKSSTLQQWSARNCVEVSLNISNYWSHAEL